MLNHLLFQAGRSRYRQVRTTEHDSQTTQKTREEESANLAVAVSAEWISFVLSQASRIQQLVALRSAQAVLVPSLPDRFDLRSTISICITG